MVFSEVEESSAVCPDGTLDKSGVRPTPKRASFPGDPSRNCRSQPALCEQDFGNRCGTTKHGAACREALCFSTANFLAFYSALWSTPRNSFQSHTSYGETQLEEGLGKYGRPEPAL